MGWKKEAISSVLILLIFGLCLHSHEHDPADQFHFHDLALSRTSQAFASCLTDGHICPCFISTLAMPAFKSQYLARLSAAKFTGFFSPILTLPLIWEIFHPPEIV